MRGMWLKREGDLPSWRRGTTPDKEGGKKRPSSLANKREVSFNHEMEKRPVALSNCRGAGKRSEKDTVGGSDRSA